MRILFEITQNNHRKLGSLSPIFWAQGIYCASAQMMGYGSRYSNNEWRDSNPSLQKQLQTQFLNKIHESNFPAMYNCYLLSFILSIIILEIIFFSIIIIWGSVVATYAGVVLVIFVVILIGLAYKMSYDYRADVVQIVRQVENEHLGVRLEFRKIECCYCEINQYEIVDVYSEYI